MKNLKFRHSEFRFKTIVYHQIVSFRSVPNKCTYWVPEALPQRRWLNTWGCAVISRKGGTKWQKACHGNHKSNPFSFGHPEFFSRSPPARRDLLMYCKCPMLLCFRSQYQRALTSNVMCMEYFSGDGNCEFLMY